MTFNHVYYIPNADTIWKPRQELWAIDSITTDTLFVTSFGCIEEYLFENVPNHPAGTTLRLERTLLPKEVN